MTKAAKEETKQTPVEALCSLREWFRSELDTSAAVQTGRPIVKGAGYDTSGYATEARHERRAAAALLIHGGGATKQREDLQRARITLAEAQARAERLKATHADPRWIAEAESGVKGAEKNVARLEALVAAAGDAHLTDQPAAVVQWTRRPQHGTRSAHRSARTIRRGSITPTWRRGSVRRSRPERRLSKAEAEWQAGCVELERLSAEHRKHFEKAQQALGAELRGVAGTHGATVRKLIAPDLDYLTANPHRCPAEAEAIYRQAVAAAEAAAALGVGGAMVAFEEEASEQVVQIIRRKMGDAPLGEPLRPRKSWHDHTTETLDKIGGLGPS